MNSIEAPLNPRKYPFTPIVLKFNPKTGYNWGEDGDNLAIGNPGYAGMRILKEHNPEPLVVPAGMEQRSVFDGESLYGDDVDDTSVYTLPGGFGSGLLYMRELPAIALDEATKIASMATDNEINFIIVNGLETEIRQQAGYTRILKGMLEKEGATTPTLTQLHQLGKKAEGAYTYVKADASSATYQQLRDELLAERETRQEIENIAIITAAQSGLKRPLATEKVIFELICISANSEIGPAKDRAVPLNVDHNPHAGGGAADIFPIDKKGRVLSLVPYCWVGPEAAMDYTEKDENFDQFKAKWAADTGLQLHMKQVGFPSPENFTMSDWTLFKVANRVRYHTFVTALGCTFYSAHNPKKGGENWHFEPDGVVLFGWDGTLLTRNLYIDNNRRAGRGNPGHTLQMSGPKAVAVYGGKSGHEQARRQKILM